MAKDFKKKLQDLLFPKPPEDSHHELVISPDDVMIGTETVKVVVCTKRAKRGREICVCVCVLVGVEQ